MKQTPATISYRRFNGALAQIGYPSLEDAIRKALVTPIDTVTFEGNWQHREHMLPDGDTLVMSYVVREENFVFAELAAYVPGQGQALLSRAKPGPQVIIDQAGVFSDYEFVRGILMFAVIENHVFVLHTRRLRPSELETYLAWMLATRTNVCPSIAEIPLVHAFDQDKVGDPGRISKVKIGGAVAGASDRAKQGGTKRPSRKRDLGERAIDRLKLRDIVEAIFGGGQAIDRFVDTLSSDDELRISLELRIRSKPRDESDAGLEDVVQALRNLPDDDVSFAGEFGVKKGGEARLSRVYQIGRDGELWDRKGVISAMLDAYKVLKRNGKIG